VLAKCPEVSPAMVIVFCSQVLAAEIVYVKAGYDLVLNALLLNEPPKVPVKTRTNPK
jgi:hypothetical protein